MQTFPTIKCMIYNTFVAGSVEDPDPNWIHTGKNRIKIDIPKGKNSQCRD